MEIKWKHIVIGTLAIAFLIVVSFGLSAALQAKADPGEATSASSGAALVNTADDTAADDPEQVVGDTTQPTPESSTPDNNQSVTQAEEAPIVPIGIPEIAPDGAAFGPNPTHIDLTKIERREQIGGALQWVNNWTIQGSTPFVVNTLPNQPVICGISSDPGNVILHGADGAEIARRESEKGFVAAFVLKPGMWLEITEVGYNPISRNCKVGATCPGNYNSWVECFAFPSSANLTDEVKNVAEIFQKRDVKPVYYIIDDKVTELSPLVNVLATSSVVPVGIPEIAPNGAASGPNPAQIDLSKIERREQIGGAGQWLNNWAVNGKVPFAVNILNQPVVCGISSDPGNVILHGTDGVEVARQSSGSFAAAVILEPGMWFEITGVGFNDHYNSWIECFVYPSSANLSDEVKIVAEEFRVRDSKPFAYFIGVDDKVVVTVKP